MASLMRFASASLSILSWRSSSLSPEGGRRIAVSGSPKSVLAMDGVRIILRNYVGDGGREEVGGGDEDDGGYIVTREKSRSSYEKKESAPYIRIHNKNSREKKKRGGGCGE